MQFGSNKSEKMQFYCIFFELFGPYLKLMQNVAQLSHGQTL